MSEISRKVQLFLMDIHLAYSIPFFINILIEGYHGSIIDYGLVIARAIIASFEIIYIFILTDKNVISEFA
ncbi:MAG: hypothetical protein SVZ03_02280 [Spirochaetota bacterium]|nr:hypothetical protein [Spirochaetota bacterium]